MEAEHFERLWESMPRRISDVLNIKESYTKYGFFLLHNFA